MTEPQLDMSRDFSHSGEYSEVIAPLFKALGVKKGFLVDVGAFGSRHSNTWNLILRGWRGIYIDADQWAYEECVIASRQSLGRVKPVKALVVPCDMVRKKVRFYRHGKGMHSVISDWINPEEKHQGRGLPEMLQGETLQGLLKRHKVPYHFDFLDVDIEGLDGPVVMDLMQSKYRPRVIMWETDRATDKHRLALGHAGYIFLTRAGPRGGANEFWVRSGREVVRETVRPNRKRR